MPEILKNISRVNLRMRRGPVVFGDVLYGPGGACGPRIQQDFQLVLLHRGSLDLRWDDQQIEVAAGQGLLLPPGHREHFLFSSEGETHHSWCAIDPDSMDPKTRKRLRSVPAPAPVNPRLERLLELGKKTFFEGAPDAALEAQFYLNLGLALLSGFTLMAGDHTRADAPPAESIVRRADEFISNEFGQSLCLKQIAGAAGVSPQHLLKLFKLRRSQTPTQLLYQRRLEAAADHLVQTGIPIKQIAALCGFANEFHFSRKFKAAYQLSPRQWRRQNWAPR